MANGRIEERGAEVYQNFRNQTPQVTVPELRACAVGVLREIIEAVHDDGSFNPDSVPNGPAVLQFKTASGGKYSPLSGDTLELIVNNGIPVVITFPTNEMKTSDVVFLIRDHSIPGLDVREVLYPSGDSTVILSTSRKGEDASIHVGPNTSASLINTIGVAPNLTVQGVGPYHSTYRTAQITAGALPDPNGRLDDVKIEWDYTKVFLDLGNGQVRRLSRDSARYRGSSVAPVIVDDGDGDSSSPILQLAEDLTLAATQVQVTGSVDITDSGFDWSLVEGKKLVLSFDGGVDQVIEFPSAIADYNEFLAVINAVWGTPVASVDGSGNLVFTAPTYGSQGVVYVSSQGSIDTATVFGIPAGRSTYLNTSAVPFPVAVGDELWDASARTLIGVVAEVAPGGNPNQIRLDRELPLTRVLGNHSYFVATGVTFPSATRPGAEVRIYDNGDQSVVELDPIILFGANQAPLQADFRILVSYRGIRQDVTARAREPEPFFVESQDELEEKYGPITPDNPLALALHIGLTVAPDSRVYGMGVDSVTEDEPFGTPAAYARALEVLESAEIYALAPLTHNDEVHQMFDFHVKAMSDPLMKSERVAFVCPSRPTRKTDLVIASGQNANVLTVPSSTVETGMSILETMVLAQGLVPSSLTEEDGVFIEFESDSNRYLVESVAQGTVVLNKGPLSYGNDFYVDANGSDVFTSQIVDRPFVLKIKGQALDTRADEAAAYADLPKKFSDRRTRVIMPDTAIFPVNSVDYFLPGFYAAAASAIQLAFFSPPGTPQGGAVLPGFKGVRGSSEYFNKQELVTLTSGGLWVLEQRKDRQEVYHRHPVTSDTSTIEKRESSITTQLDFSSKLIRSSIQHFTNKRNITATVMDDLNLVLDGCVTYLVDTKRVVGGLALGDLIQPDQERDALELDVEVTVLYPLNKIRIRLHI